MNEHPPGPLACPRCGEKQNAYGGKFDPRAEPFGPFRCMACGHILSRAEYEAARAEFAE